MNDTNINEEKQSIEKDDLVSSITTKTPPKQNFLTQWIKGLNDLESDPRQFPRFKKSMILMTVALATAVSPISSTIYLPALVDMQLYFKTSPTTINSSLSAFTFANAVFPLIWAPLGEVFGRRRAYLISFFIALAGTIGCALSVNVAMFIAFRAIAAMGSSSVMSMGAGTIADIFEVHERGRAMALYSCGPLLGPALGPIVGGYLNNAFGWRSNFWAVCIFILVIWLSILLFLPETWRPTEKISNKEKLKRMNPIKIFQFFLYPNIALCIGYGGMILLMYYLINTTFTRTYTLLYGLDSGTVGLCYLPLAVGGMVGSNVGGRFADRIYNRRVKALGDQAPYPEMRISLGLIGIAVGLQIASFVAYGWCIEKHVHMAWGLVCQFTMAIGLMIPIVTISTYCVDCFRQKSSSVTACNNFARYTLAGVGALIATDIETALGPGIMYSMCAGIIAVSYVLLIFVQKNHRKWEKYRVMKA